MSGAELLLLCAAAIGLSFLFGELRWFRRRSLLARLRPYGATGAAALSPTPSSSPTAVLVTLVDQLVDRVTGTLGIRDDLTLRLARADLHTTPTAFRSRQALHAVVALAVGGTAALLLRPGPVTTLMLLIGVPTLAVLIPEQRLSSRIARRSHRLQLELPVIAEQLGILIDSGTSLPAAITRVSRRGRGASAEDLHRVALRIRGGTSETTALTEWAERTDVEAVRRLVSVLSLHREAGDLGRLISEEARAIRAETHRELLERIERRDQLVWIPVTVATLVPGLLFLAVPFVSALAQVSGP